MSSEEIASIRAEFALRPRRKARTDHCCRQGFSSARSLHTTAAAHTKNKRNDSNIGKQGKLNYAGDDTIDNTTSSNGTVGKNHRPRRKEGGWLEVQRIHIEAQRITAERVAKAAAEGRRSSTNDQHNNSDHGPSRPHSSSAPSTPERGHHKATLIYGHNNSFNHGDHHSYRDGGSGGGRTGIRGKTINFFVCRPSGFDYSCMTVVPITSLQFDSIKNGSAQELQLPGPFGQIAVTKLTIQRAAVLYRPK